MPNLPQPNELLRELVALPGPPGQEAAVREAVAAYVAGLGLPCETDARGNLLVGFGETVPDRPTVVVTAHLDEIALQVAEVNGDGTLRVAPLGGTHPWKWGEGPVEIMARDRLVPGVLGFGSIHTTSPASYAQQARDGRPLTWDAAQVLTGLSARELTNLQVRAGTRVVIARHKRALWPIGGGLIGSYFLDDRADLVAWLLALAELKENADAQLAPRVLFVATSAEEVGGHGALWLLGRTRPEVCIALEIGPQTPDAPFDIDENPTVWVSDSYAPSLPSDLQTVADTAQTLGLSPHFHVVTRGGSDASCAASQGLCARPITLAFAAQNSHGFEVMHENAPANLARLTAALVPTLLHL